MSKKYGLILCDDTTDESIIFNTIRDHKFIAVSNSVQKLYNWYCSTYNSKANINTVHQFVGTTSCRGHVNCTIGTTLPGTWTTMTLGIIIELNDDAMPIDLDVCGYVARTSIYCDINEFIMNKVKELIGWRDMSQKYLDPLGESNINERICALLPMGDALTEVGKPVIDKGIVKVPCLTDKGTRLTFYFR